MKQWYYAKNEQKIGPVKDEEMIQLIQTGELSPETLVWKEGLDDWTPLHDMQIYDIHNPTTKEKEYGGMGRGAYFGLLLLCGFIQSLTSKTPELFWLGAVAALFIGGMRLRNIGYSPWGTLLLLIPLVNLVIAYRCLACPAGYAQTKQPDLIMKRVNWIYAIAIICIFLAILIPAIAGR